jgi:hypothetical protein
MYFWQSFIENLNVIRVRDFTIERKTPGNVLSGSSSPRRAENVFFSRTTES